MSDCPEQSLLSSGRAICAESRDGGLYTERVEIDKILFVIDGAVVDMAGKLVKLSRNERLSVKKLLPIRPTRSNCDMRLLSPDNAPQDRTFASATAILPDIELTCSIISSSKENGSSLPA